MEPNSLINYPSRQDLYLEDVVKGEDNVKAEFICPFCADEFDIVGLCCHIDEDHPVEVKNGICPVCSKKVGLDIVGHITTQHGNVFKRMRRFRRGGYSSNYLTLKKELQKGNIQSLGFGGSSTYIPSSNIDSDPLLSPFMFRPPSANQLVIHIKEGVSPKDTPQSNVRQVSLSNEDQEKARKSEFVGDLLWSTMV